MCNPSVKQEFEQIETLHNENYKWVAWDPTYDVAHVVKSFIITAEAAVKRAARRQTKEQVSVHTCPEVTHGWVRFIHFALHTQLHSWHSSKFFLSLQCGACTVVANKHSHRFSPKKSSRPQIPWFLSSEPQNRSPATAFDWNRNSRDANLAVCTLQGNVWFGLSFAEYAGWVGGSSTKRKMTPNSRSLVTAAWPTSPKHEKATHLCRLEIHCTSGLSRPLGFEWISRSETSDAPWKKIQI